MGRLAFTSGRTAWLLMVKSMAESGLGAGVGGRFGGEELLKKATFIIHGIVSKTLSTQIIGHKFPPEIRE